MRSLREDLDDPERASKLVSKYLPPALQKVSQKNSFAQTILPAVEKAVAISVRRNPKVLTDVVFPIIGPAIRKAVSAALREMVVSLNQIVEQSFTLRGLKWRIEAARTGRSVAEVALRHALIYRVEQLFLVHQPTGLLLQHVAAPIAEAQDGDLVSAMLTAIRDFVQDSFQADGESLDTLRVGELDVWIEQRAELMLAAVIRGNAPLNYRGELQAALENLYLEHYEALKEFQGDPEPFANSEAQLETYLRSESKQGSVQLFPLIVLTLTILSILGAGAYAYYQHRVQLLSPLESLRAEPGYMLLEHQLDGRQLRVKLLKDPLARALPQVLGSQLSQVKSQLGYYQAPEFALKRVKYYAPVPKGARLEVNEAVLVASGVAPKAWVSELERGVKLAAAPFSLQTASLVLAEEKALQEAITQLQNHRVHFPVASALPQADEELQALQQWLMQVSQRAAEAQHKQLEIVIYGATDESGAAERNQSLRKKRAEYVLKQISAANFPHLQLRAQGLEDVQDHTHGRVVFLKVKEE